MGRIAKSRQMKLWEVARAVGSWRTGWKSSRRHTRETSNSQEKNSGAAYRRQFSKNMSKNTRKLRRKQILNIRELKEQCSVALEETTGEQTLVNQKMTGETTAEELMVNAEHIFNHRTKPKTKKVQSGRSECQCLCPDNAETIQLAQKGKGEEDDKWS